MINLCAFADEAGNLISQQISAMSENGIRLLEMRGVNGVNVAKLTEEQAKNAKAELDAANIRTWSLGSPIGKCNINDNFDSELEKFKRVLETAYITNASCIRLFSFYNTDGKSEYSSEVMLRLSRFCEIAKGSNVTLCHENEKDIYGDTPERCLEIHKALPEIKLIYDPANFIQCGVDTLKAWNMLKQYVYYLHIKDALSDGTVVPAGYGEGNLSVILPEYVAAGGSVLTIEPHLTVFSGFTELEKDTKKPKNKFVFSSNKEAFDCAVNSLKAILPECNIKI